MAQKFNGNVEVGGTLLAGILESEVLGDKLKETVQRFIAEYGDKTVHDLFSEKEQNITESLAEFEQAFSLQRETLEQTFCTQMQKYEEMKTELTAMTEKYNEAVKHFNAAIETINNLTERVAALEVNYDPTIIQ